jgi:hypothetical protein
MGADFPPSLQPCILSQLVALNFEILYFNSNLSSFQVPGWYASILFSLVVCVRVRSEEQHDDPREGCLGWSGPSNECREPALSASGETKSSPTAKNLCCLQAIHTHYTRPLGFHDDDDDDNELGASSSASSSGFSRSITLASSIRSWSSQMLRGQAGALCNITRMIERTEREREQL